ncbi:HEAT repeat domain-containing protein [Rhodohalobacter sp. SW132]|uniref:HEAT repeat domain-containing protein n=1 Tax=Rhodohalobacter sp. SW132 TaxID=2293433 RepID=UPI000E25CF12|nr:HEAT repeat domain-containing protein [Rhodohalobacter sp. SW132]REL32803.1 HEAT repeat domain-containing protein [Rhodohalobacter sp. SW132]
MKCILGNAFPFTVFCLIVILITSCSNQKETDSENEKEQTTEVSENDPPEVSDELSETEEIEFYIDKLPDRDFTETYGHGYTWYTAAEELGMIGKPAIPHLIRQLSSDDEYVVMLSLYALQLASQDSAVTEKTGGEYIELEGTVLSKESNSRNIQVAESWWNKHRHLWD